MTTCTVKEEFNPPGALADEAGPVSPPPKLKHVELPPEVEAKASETPASPALPPQPEISPRTKSFWGDWFSTFTQHSDATTVDGGHDLYPNVTWQWEHKTGWRDYARKVSNKIEFAYRSGETKTRVQTGKKGAVPMEIFFEDMLQHDPVTGNTRNVQRTGPWSRWKQLKRFTISVTRALETGRQRKESYADYQKRRQEHHEKMEPEEFEDRGPYGRHCCGLIASSPLFFFCTMMAVIMYTIWLGIDADWNTAHSLHKALPIFQVVENIFCVFFTTELVIRFCGFQRKSNCWTDTWFIFDLVLAMLMIIEVWIMPIIFIFAPEVSDWFQQFTLLRTLRLARLARLTSLLRAFPEAMMLLKGIYAAVRGVITTLVLLVVMTFIFGLIFKAQAIENEELAEQYFSSLSHSMWSLFMHATLLDGPAQVYLVIEVGLGKVMAGLFVLFIFISAFTVMNMLIGILCEVINKVSETEKEEAQIRWLKRHMQDIFECYDVNQDKHIGVKEFDLLLKNLEFRETLQLFGTDIQTFGDIVTAEYRTKTTSMSFGELVSYVLRLKGGNNAQVTDIADLRKCVNQLESRLENSGMLEEKYAPTQPPRVESIKVRIETARGLRNADVVPLTGKSDVYCKCVVLGKPGTGVRTEVVKDSIMPTWNQEFVMADYQAGEHLRFQLFDQDIPFVKEDDYLGSAVLESSRFCPQGFDGELRLTGGGKGVEAYLKVKVKVKLLPESEPDLENPPKSSGSACSVGSNDSAGASNMAMILARLDDVYASQKSLCDQLKRVEERMDIVEVAVTRH